MKRLGLVLVAVALAGSAGGAAARAAAPVPRPTQTPGQAMRALIGRDRALAGTVTTLYTSGGWSVVQSTARGRASAVAFRRVDGRWRAEGSRAVSIQILGPRPGARGLASVMQVAMEVRSHTPFVETGLWVDGTYVVPTGGGTPTNGTIYANLAHPLARGLHVAVGYARTATAASAVAWTFTVS